MADPRVVHVVRCRWRVHRCVAASVDALLEGRQPPSELRWRGPRGEVLLKFEGSEAAKLARGACSFPSRGWST
jgi:hypothetical protein